MTKKVKKSKTTGKVYSSKKLPQAISQAVKIRSLAKFGRGYKNLQGYEILQPLRNIQGLLHLSVVLLVLPLSTLIPIDFFMLELNHCPQDI